MIKGLSDRQNQEVLEIIFSFNQISKVMVFGSRAIGNFKSGSDVDLAIWGDNVGPQDAVSLAIKLNEESTLPFKFDVVAYNAISSNGLREHITNIGEIVFERQ